MRIGNFLREIGESYRLAGRNFVGSFRLLGGLIGGLYRRFLLVHPKRLEAIGIAFTGHKPVALKAAASAAPQFRQG
jgi:hypothetical protein